MTLQDVMTKQVTTCRPETNLAIASALMWENDCAALPVLDEAGRLVGILTDRDVCIALGTRNARASDVAVRDVVEMPPLSCKSTDDVATGLNVLLSTKIRLLPVVNDAGTLEGMVSIDNIVPNIRSSGDQFANHRAAA